VPSGKKQACVLSVMAGIDLLSLVEHHFFKHHYQIISRKCQFK
jgi:hypothetical protein